MARPKLTPEQKILNKIASLKAKIEARKLELAEQARERKRKARKELQEVLKEEAKELKKLEAGEEDPRYGRGNPAEKLCPRCGEAKPLEAFRRYKRAGRECIPERTVKLPDGTTRCRECCDSYCKHCRWEWRKANMPVEAERWRRYAHNNAKELQERKSHTKAMARQKARRKFKKPHACDVKGCTKRAQRHHYKGYTGEAATAIMWLCPSHHALEHILEKARARTGPSWY